MSKEPQTPNTPQSNKAQPAVANTAQASAAPEQKTSAKDKAPPPNKKPQKKSTGIIGFLVLLVLLVVLIAGLGGVAYFGWGWWQTLQTQQVAAKESQLQILDQQQKLQQQVQQLQQFQTNSNSEADTVINSMRAELTAIAQRQASHNKRLLSLANTSREDWLLAEAEYLLRLANQRLLIEKDTRAAQGMVETADKILLELDEVDLYPLRKSLASDLVKLKLASKIDKEQLYLRLQALADNIQALPLLMEMQRKQAVAAMQTETPTTVVEESVQSTFSHWVTSRAHGLWEKIKSYVRVREHSATVQPLLPPESDLFLRQNLRFLLTHAQLAMLQEQPLIYHNSLQQAQQWLREYYQLSEPAQNFIAELQDLEQLTIVQQVPDISASSRELQAYIERLHKIGEDATEAQP